MPTLFQTCQPSRLVRGGTQALLLFSLGVQSELGLFDNEARRLLWSIGLSGTYQDVSADGGVAIVAR